MKTLSDIENILPEPIVIEVENTSNVTRSRIRLFGGFSYTPAMINPFAGVTIRSGLSSINYSQIVSNSQKNVLKIGMFGFSSLQNDPKINFTPTLQNSVRIGKTNITGSGSYKNITLRDDPYGKKATVYAPLNFDIDNESAIILKTIHAGETIQILLFPAIPEMKKVTFPDVQSGVIRVGNAMLNAGGEEIFIEEGSPNYKINRMIGGAVLVAGICGLIYLVGKD